MLYCRAEATPSALRYIITNSQSMRHTSTGPSPIRLFVSLLYVTLRACLVAGRSCQLPVGVQPGPNCVDGRYHSKACCELSVDGSSWVKPCYLRKRRGGGCPLQHTGVLQLENSPVYAVDRGQRYSKTSFGTVHLALSKEFLQNETCFVPPEYQGEQIWRARGHGCSRRTCDIRFSMYRAEDEEDFYRCLVCIRPEFSNDSSRLAVACSLTTVKPWPPPTRPCEGKDPEVEVVRVTPANSSYETLTASITHSTVQNNNPRIPFSTTILIVIICLIIPVR